MAADAAAAVGSIGVIALIDGGMRSRTVETSIGSLGRTAGADSGGDGGGETPSSVVALAGAGGTGRLARAPGPKLTAPALETACGSADAVGRATGSGAPGGASVGRGWLAARAERGGDAATGDAAAKIGVDGEAATGGATARLDGAAVGVET